MFQKMQLKLNWFSEEISEKQIQYIEQKEVKTKTNGVSLRWFFQTCFFIKNKLLFMLKMFYKCFLAALFYEEGWWFKKNRSFLKDLRAKSCFFHYFFKKKVLHILYHGSRMGAVVMKNFWRQKNIVKTHIQNHDPFLIHGTRFSKNVKNDFCNLVADSRFH